MFLLYSNKVKQAMLKNEDIMMKILTDETANKVLLADRKLYCCCFPKEIGCHCCGRRVTEE